MTPFLESTAPCEHSASALASALAARAEQVCRRYLPRGRKQGRYWTVGDVHGTEGRSLYVRLAPPGIPGWWMENVAAKVMLRRPRITCPAVGSVRIAAT